MLSLHASPPCDPRYSDVGHDTIRVSGGALSQLLKRVEYGAVQFQRGGPVDGRMHIFGRSTACPTFMVQMVGDPRNLHTLSVTVVFGRKVYNVAAVKLMASVLAWVECGGRDPDGLADPANEGKGQPVVDWLDEVIRGLEWSQEKSAERSFGERVYRVEFVHVESGIGSMTVSVSPLVDSN